MSQFSPYAAVIGDDMTMSTPAQVGESHNHPNGFPAFAVVRWYRRYDG